MKKAAIYARVSTADQHVESQLYDLRRLAEERGLEIVKEYSDKGVSGTKARRPGLDALMVDARQRKFSVVLVAAFDRVARSTKHFLRVMDELDSPSVQFVSRRENIDTSGPMSRLFLTLISSIAELESDLIRERVRAGMRRARLAGRQIGRTRLDIDRQQVVTDRRSGMSLTQVARKHGISRASVCRMVKESDANSASTPASARLAFQAGAQPMSNSQIEPAAPLQDDRVGKPFLVMTGGVRKCLVCQELFSRQEAPRHSRIVCYPREESGDADR
jgi:DNA invertase Pin-like site-specific DNA recombinase